ncbi:hypothetical protein [Calidifontibacter terrae]
MNTTAASSSPAGRRTLRGLMSAVSVAVLGVAMVPAADAQAAGVTTHNYRNVAAAAAPVTPTDLPTATTAQAIRLTYAGGSLTRRS